MEVVDLARDSLNPELELLGVVLNIANMRTKHARQTLEALRERFGDAVCRTVIRQSIAYAESAERAIPILDYRPDRGADYLSLAGELLRRLSRQDLLESLDELSAELVPAGAARASSGSELGDVGAQRGERHPPDLGPALGRARSSASTTLPVSCQKHQSSTDGPGARDRRADRAQLGGRRDQLASSAGRGAARRGWCRRSARPRAIRARSERSMPSTSWVAAATLATASASGTVGGQRGARIGGRDLLVRDHQHGLDALRRLEPDGGGGPPSSARGQTTKPP